jgi:hypothetical protein
MGGRRGLRAKEVKKRRKSDAPQSFPGMVESIELRDGGSNIAPCPATFAGVPVTRIRNAKALVLGVEKVTMVIYPTRESQCSLFPKRNKTKTTRTSPLHCSTKQHQLTKECPPEHLQMTNPRPNGPAKPR